jgi:hypothetical protein
LVAEVRRFSVCRTQAGVQVEGGLSDVEQSCSLVTYAETHILNALAYLSKTGVNFCTKWRKRGE